MVGSQQSTLENIQNKVRRLTASPDEATLSTQDLQERINTFYEQDFPYAIKLDQTRQVIKIFTEPNIDVYPVDIQTLQGIRDPVYFEGTRGALYKDRGQFFNAWPRTSQSSTPAYGDGLTSTFSWTIGGVPFLRNMVVIGYTNTSGASVAIADDGLGGFVIGNTTTVVPGSVNYVTGVFTNLIFPSIPASGTPITLWVAQYSAARPYSILFWNNEITVRPVPNNVYKIEYEAYQTPVGFLATTESPTIKQWWQYIAYGVAAEILRDRQDMEGVSNLMEGFKRQEQLVLERQGVEEIGVANSTIYNSSTWPNGTGQGIWW